MCGINVVGGRGGGGEELELRPGNSFSTWSCTLSPTHVMFDKVVRTSQLATSMQCPHLNTRFFCVLFLFCFAKQDWARQKKAGCGLLEWWLGVSLARAELSLSKTVQFLLYVYPVKRFSPSGEQTSRCQNNQPDHQWRRRKRLRWNVHVVGPSSCSSRLWR